MVRVIGSRDCGNSPKNQFAQEIGVALECGNFLADAFPDEMVWERHDGTIEGPGAIKAALAALTTPSTITVEHAITHGKVGAVSGRCTLPDGATRRFGHVLEFTSAKANQVARIKSYS